MGIAHVQNEWSCCIIQKQPPKLGGCSELFYALAINQDQDASDQCDDSGQHQLQVDRGVTGSDQAHSPPPAAAIYQSLQ